MNSDSTNSVQQCYQCVNGYLPSMIPIQNSYKYTYNTNCYSNGIGMTRCS